MWLCVKLFKFWLITDFRVAFNRHGDIRIGGEFKKKPIRVLHHLTN